MKLIKNINFDEKGLIPAVVQDATTGEVLMLGYMNEESLRRTMKDKEVWFYSRSRQELWHKGETSGNIIKLKNIKYNCENNSLLVTGIPTGPVCHTGNKTCFYQRIDGKRPQGVGGYLAASSCLVYFNRFIHGGDGYFQLFIIRLGGGH